MADLEGVPWAPWNPSFEDPAFVFTANLVIPAQTKLCPLWHTLKYTEATPNLHSADCTGRAYAISTQFMNVIYSLRLISCMYQD